MYHNWGPFEDISESSIIIELHLVSEFLDTTNVNCNITYQMKMNV